MIVGAVAVVGDLHSPRCFLVGFYPPIRCVSGPKGPVTADPSTGLGTFYRLDTRMLLKSFDPSSKSPVKITTVRRMAGEEDYDDMSDDDEVAVHVPESPEDIPIISDLTNWLHRDLVENRLDLE
ncbi:hypothetical protein BV898_09706 [Hypsibius exemplaris]|uniref:Uncharacterized protein n=1 Tax=Hypsibius exemplaris TaxID=2072580 RepID=A0A1W0WM19_HYPEX|nr:hypothetical protein BV898_09706 [Hypsibius exemplaris]